MLKKIGVSIIVLSVSILSFGYAKAEILTGSTPSVPSIHTVTDTAKGTSNTVKNVSDTINKTTDTVTKKDTKIIEEPVDTACELITSKVKGKISLFEKNLSKHSSYYVNERKSFASLIAKLDQKGINTSKLKDDLATLDGKIKRFNDESSGVTSNLNSIKEIKCNKKDPASALQNAQISEKKVKTNAEDILSFLNGTIQNDIKALHS